MKIEIDFDDPDLPPLNVWLYILRSLRIWHEYQRDRNVQHAADRLGISRFTVYRALDKDESAQPKFRPKVKGLPS